MTDDRDYREPSDRDYWDLSDDAKPRRRPAQIVIAVVAGVALLIGAYLWSEHKLPWQGPDVSELASEVRESMQSSLTSDERYKPYNLTVIKVTLIKSGDNTYDGMAAIKPLNGPQGDVPVDVTYDGENLLWQTQPGAFMFLLQAPTPGMAS